MIDVAALRPSEIEAISRELSLEQIEGIMQGVHRLLNEFEHDDGAESDIIFMAAQQLSMANVWHRIDPDAMARVFIETPETTRAEFLKGLPIEYAQRVARSLMTSHVKQPTDIGNDIAHEGASGATAQIDGRSFDNFASYDYLGLNHHPKVLARASEALQTFGVSASASRVVAGERTIHTVLEGKIADIYDAQAAVCFVSGYLTNVAAISSLVRPKDLVIHDEFIHNSALAGIRLSGATRRFFKHNDTADLDRVLKTLAGDYERILVIVEGVYSMDGDIADLPALIRLKEQYGFWLMVDEAHSLGVLGETGRGVFEHFGIAAGEVDIWMGTLSKTICSCGGYIAGSEALITLLKAQAGGFVYSVGLAPALAAAAIASLEILKAEPERTHQLRRNSHLFLELARERGLDTGLSQGYSVVPVLVADSLRAVQLSNELHAEGINVLPIIHPAVPEGLARLRFFITSAHTDEQIARAVDRTAVILGRLKQENFGLASFDAGQLMALFAKS